MKIDIKNVYDLLPSQIYDVILKLKDALNIVKEKKETFSKIANFERHKHECPYCNSTNFIKYGHKDNIQNYLCKDCSRKFNDLTGTVFASTHLNYEQIEIFVNCFIDRIPIRKVATRMGVNKNTVYLLRQKILDSFKEIRENVTLSGEVEADEIYRPINLKGTKRDKMPRFSKHRMSKGTTTRGISNHKVCVIGVIDENDSMFLQIVGNGQLTSKMVELALTPKMGKIKKLNTDCKSSYESEAKKK